MLVLPLMAQQTGIAGRISDPSQAVVAGVIVTATGANGTNETTSTNAGGLYQFPGLSAGDYRLRFEASGFAPAERTVTLLVGQTATVDLTIQLSQTSSTVNVEAVASAVDTSSSTLAGNVSPTEVQKVPLNGRNFLQLAMLVPGITSNDVQTSVLGGTDIGKMQINVDGQQVTQTSASTGSGQPLYSQEAIDQYQIITNRFDSTMGRSGRVQVVVQTKSGTNNFHGSLFGYFRNDEFNAADPVAHKVLPFSDQQFGGSVGGPILKNKLFFFFAYEGERSPSTIFDAPTGYTSLAGQQLTFTFANNLNTRTYLLHTDWQISKNHRLSVRGSGSTYLVPFASVSGTSAPTRATVATRTNYGAVGTWTWILSPAMVNEAKIGFNHFDWANNALLSTQEYRLPQGTWGSPYNYPQQLAQNVQQYRDDLYWLKGGHSLKFGVDFQHTPYSGNFGQNVRGTVLSFSPGVTSVPLINVFPVWNQPSTWNLSLLNPYVTQFTQGFGSFLYSLPTNGIGGWVQDDWKISRKVTLNLGLRYDNDLGIFNPNLHLKTGYPTAHTNPDLMFQPRVGFTYDPTGSRKTVIRGGAGIFYSFVNANATIDGQIFNGQTTLSPAITPTAANPINLANPWNGVTGAQFLSGQVPVSTQSIQVLDPDVRTPYSLQASIGVARQITRDWSMTADFVHFRVYHDWVDIDGNLSYNPATGYPLNPATNGRPLPYYAGVRDFATPDAASQIYDGLQVGIQHRFAQSFSASIAYTLQRLKDSNTGSSPGGLPNNPFNLAGEWGPSYDQQRHTLSLTGAYSLKWGFSLSGALHYGSGQNFIVTSSQNPFGLTYFTSRIFTNTTRYYINPKEVSPAQGLPGYDIVARDSFIGQPIIRVDMRLSKTFTVKDRFRFTPMIEAFNLFNHSNFGNYQLNVNVASFGLPAQVTDLPYYPRMLQFAGRFEF